MLATRPVLPFTVKLLLILINPALAPNIEMAPNGGRLFTPSHGVAAVVGLADVTLRTSKFGVVVFADVDT